MADSLTIPKTALPFPELGSPAYLQTMRALKMFRSVPVSQYPRMRVRRLIEEAQAKRRAFYSPGLHSLDILAKLNC